MGEAVAGFGAAAQVEGDQEGGRGHGGEDGSGFAAFDFGRAAAGVGDLDDAEIGAQARVVAGKEVGFGAAAEAADGDERKISQR